MRVEEIVDANLVKIAGAMALAQLTQEDTLPDVFRAGLIDICDQVVEAAAQIHESVRTWCDHEPEAGAGAMGAVIHYRDEIRKMSR